MTTTRRLSGMPQSSTHQQFGVMLETYEAFRKKHVAQNKEIITKNSELHKTNAGLIQERSLMQAQNLSIRGTLLQKEAELLNVRDQLWRSEENERELREELIRVKKRNGTLVDHEQVEVMGTALATALNALQAFHSLLPSNSTPPTPANTPLVPSSSRPRPRPVSMAPPPIVTSNISRRQVLAERQIPLQPVVSQASDLSLINEGESEEDEKDLDAEVEEEVEEEEYEVPRRFNRFTPSPPLVSSSHSAPRSTSPQSFPLPLPIPLTSSSSLPINTSNPLSPPLPQIPIAKSLQPRSSSTSSSTNRRVSGLIRPPPPPAVEEGEEPIVHKKKERPNSSRVKATLRPNELDDEFELPLEVEEEEEEEVEEIVSKSKRRGGGRRSVLIQVQEPIDSPDIVEEEKEEVEEVENNRVEERRRKRRESSGRRKSILPIPSPIEAEDGEPELELEQDEGKEVVQVVKGGSELLRARKEEIRKSKLRENANEEKDEVAPVEEVVEIVTGRRKGKGRMVIEEDVEERDTEEPLREEEEFDSQPASQASLAAGSQEEETGGRRARKSVNYALPKLNTKMRRPADYVPVTSAAAHSVVGAHKPRKSTKTPSSSSTAKSPRKSTSAPLGRSVSPPPLPPPVPSLPPSHATTTRQPSLAGKKPSNLPSNPIESKPLPQVPADSLTRSARPHSSRAPRTTDSTSEDESEREDAKDDEDEWNEEKYLAKMKRGTGGSRVAGGRGGESLISSRRRHSVAV